MAIQSRMVVCRPHSASAPAGTSSIGNVCSSDSPRRSPEPGLDASNYQSAAASIDAAQAMKQAGRPAKCASTRACRCPAPGPGCDQREIAEDVQPIGYPCELALIGIPMRVVHQYYRAPGQETGDEGVAIEHNSMSTQQRSAERMRAAV